MRQSYLPVLQVGPEAVFIRHHLFSTLRHMPLLRCDNAREKLLAAQWKGMSFKERLPYILASKIKLSTNLHSLEKLTNTEISKASALLARKLASGKIQSLRTAPRKIALTEKNEHISGYKAFVRAQMIVLSLCRRELSSGGYDLNNLWSHLDLAKHEIEKDFCREKKTKKKVKMLGHNQKMLKAPVGKIDSPEVENLSSSKFMSFLNTSEASKMPLSLQMQHKKFRSSWFKLSKEHRSAW